MKKNSKKSNEILIQKILKHFNGLDQDEFKADISKAQNSDVNKNYLKDFIKKYSQKELNEQNSREILYEIISKLVNLRQDFLTCIKIYLATEDKEKAEALRRHYILKEEKLNKFKDGEINGNGDTYIEFGISLSCIFEVETYYKKFIRGILRYFQAAFKENYLYEYINCEDFQSFNKYQYYEKHISTFGFSLNNMLIDMERVIFEHNNELSNINSEKKIVLATFEIFQLRAHLEDNDKIKEIYQKCNNNNEILGEIRKLKEKTDEKKEKDFFGKLKLFEYDVEQYIKEENDKIKLNNENANQKAINKKQEAKIMDLETSIKNLEATNKMRETTIKNLEDTNKKHETTIEKLNTTVSSQQNEIDGLKGKVNYMEPLVLSLICRKALNHSFIKILEKYNKQLKIIKQTLSNNENNYIITFIKSVGGVSVEELNNLIDKLFLRKDSYNNNSHLVEKAQPSFIPDLWKKVKELLELNPNETIAFDAIITDEIKASFSFGAKDITVKQYLNAVDLSKFGK